MDLVCLRLAVCSFSGLFGVCRVGVQPRRTQGGQRGGSDFQKFMAAVVHALLPLRSLYQPSHGVEPIQIYKLAFYDLVVEARSVEDVAVAAQDGNVRQVSRAVFAEEEQVPGPTVRHADTPAVFELVGPPAQVDTQIVEGTLGKAVAVHTQAATRRRDAGYVGHPQVFPATSQYLGCGRHDPPPLNHPRPCGPRRKRQHGCLSACMPSRNGPCVRPRKRSAESSRQAWRHPRKPAPIGSSKLLDSHRRPRMGGLPGVPQRSIPRQRAPDWDARRFDQDSPSRDRPYSAAIYVLFFTIGTVRNVCQAASSDGRTRPCGPWPLSRVARVRSIGATEGSLSAYAHRLIL